MNTTRLESFQSRFDKHIRKCITEVETNIAQMFDANVSRKEISQYLISFYECINPEMVKFCSTNGEISDEYLDAVRADGIVMLIPPVDKLDWVGVVDSLKELGIGKEEPQDPDVNQAGPLHELLTSRRREEKTPLGGLPDKRPDLCRIETEHGGCGCAFGQCGRGLIH
jgi:hypothetical protein